MISSTRADLMQYRKTASAIIEKLRKENQAKRGIIEVSMEEAVQTGKREYAVALSKKWVKDSDWVILIVGWHYGTITDEKDADGLGVTEWEYRHALALGKEIFVFAAGVPNSADAYRASDRAKAPLNDWTIQQTPEQLEKLKAFRQELTTRHAAFFRDLDAFEKKLELTLRDNIDKLTLVVPPGSSLADLILAVEPAIEECAVSVMRLKCYKDIHDALHIFRQEVIKPIRDGVLPQWIKEGNLGRAVERKLSKLDRVAADEMRGIQDKRISFQPGDTTDLAESLDMVKRSLPIWDPPIDNAASDAQPDIGVFSENLDNFAAVVQVAFTLANDAMQRQNRIFDRLHSALQTEISKARSDKGLSTAESATLDEEIGKVSQNAEDLAKTLGTHANWQTMHDKIESLQEHRDTDKYVNKLLPNFFNNELTRMKRLAADALTYARNKPNSRGELLIQELEAFESSLAIWSTHEKLEEFDSVRSAFDISFYKIDKNTKRIVDRSTDRVSGLLTLLRKLHGNKTVNDKKPTDGGPT